MKRVLKVVLGITVSVAALLVAFRDLDLEKVGATLQQARWWPLAPFFLFFGVHLVARSLRWRYFLPDVSSGKPSIRNLFDGLMLGAFASFVLPLRAGEFIRPLVLTRWSSHTFATAFVSVVIERFFDLAAVLLTFAIITPFLPSIPPEFELGAYGLGMMALGLLCFLIASCLMPAFITSTCALVLRPLPRKVAGFLEKFVGDLVVGASVIRTPARLAIILGLTAVVWLTAYLQFYAFLMMFPGSPSLLLSAAVGVFVALAIAVPSAPGFIGVYQMGCVGACALFGYPLEVSQAFALVAHGIPYVLFILIGMWLLGVHGLSFSQLRKQVAPTDACT
jgi:uncharacterized protein (TIRG00374 family)